MHIPPQRPLSPGEILQTEFMRPHGLTQGDLAELMGVSRQRVNEIVNGAREISADSAIRLSQLFGVSPQFWLMCQLRLDLWETMNDPAKAQEYEKIKPINKRL